jgi:hypothetical protein
MSSSNNSGEYKPNNCQYNWWGTPNPDDGFFDPEADFDYSNPLSSAPYPAWNIDPPEWLAFAQAVDLENAGSYSSAIDAYMDIVEDYTETSVAMESIKRIFYLTNLTNGSFANLQAYYQDIVDTCTFVPIARAADELITRCLVEAAEFQDALDRCEEVIANPPSVADSVFAVIEAGYVYLAAAAGGGGLDVLEPVGIYPQMQPASLEDYRHRCEQAMKLILSTEDEQLTYKKELAAIPTGFSLSKPYPNPFNASTRISYSLLEARDVNLAVYDVLGRKVVTLLDDRQEAGEHDVVWYGQSSTGIPVSSGIYFIRMSTETGVQSAKMLLLK